MRFSRLLELRIRQSPLFQHLAEEDLKNIEADSEIRKFEAGNLLGSEGSSPSFMMMILSGSVDIRTNNADGTETLLRRLGPPVVFGYCLLSGQPYSADIVATGTVVAACFPIQKLKRTLTAQPETLFTVIGHLSSLVEDLSRERIELKSTSLAERICRVLEDIAEPDGACSISHEELGQMAGGSRANVSRALKELETSDRVELGRRRISLKGERKQA